MLQDTIQKNGDQDRKCHIDILQHFKGIYQIKIIRTMVKKLQNNGTYYVK